MSRIKFKEENLITENLFDKGAITEIRTLQITPLRVWE